MSKLIIDDLLKEYKLSKTENRIQLIKLFMKEHHFKTITEINEELKGMNTKSIYNNIKQLEDVGLVESISLRGEIRYQIIDSIEHTHPVAHVYSNKETKVKHLDLPNKIKEDIQKIAQKENIKIKSLKIFIEKE